MELQNLFVKEVAQKSFVLELQKLDFRRESRRKASFLSFKLSCEGSLARKLRFSASKFYLRRSRREGFGFSTFHFFSFSPIESQIE